jgi:hypothetical protein
MITTPPSQSGAWSRISLTTTAICVLLAVAGVLLWRDHRAHAFALLPYLLIAACPIMHLLMHRGHGGHSHRARHR